MKGYNKCCNITCAYEAVTGSNYCLLHKGGIHGPYLHRTKLKRECKESITGRHCPHFSGGWFATYRCCWCDKGLTDRSGPK